MKQLESQLLELRMRVDEQSRLSQDLGLNKSRLLSENTEFTRQVEELDAQMTQTAHLKTHFIAQLVRFFKVKNKIRGKGTKSVFINERPIKSMEFELFVFGIWWRGEGY